MKQYGLYSSKSAFDAVYDQNVDATVKNSFGAAAFRFGHSQVLNNIALMNDRYRRTFDTPIENTYNKPTLCLGNSGKNIADLLRWMATDKSAKIDNEFESGVRDKTFIDHNGQGFDLSAFNIQRGRDHGLPGYNEFRKLCQLVEATETDSGQWNLPDHSSDVTEILSQLYSHPNDIDLFAAGISEIPVKGGKVGPIFACLIGKQFKDLKQGDRFWYENDYEATGFTADQVNEIKKIKLSSVICFGTGVTSIQKKAFITEKPRKKCKRHSVINLQKWQADTNV